MDKKEYLKIIKKADIAYYEDDSPIMSDTEYNDLRTEFIKIYGDKDLNYVPGAVSNKLTAFKHTYNINSLDKIKFYETEKLNNEIKKLLPIVAELKIDGLTIVSYPKGDGSSIFVTRGNGFEGEIIPQFKNSLNQHNMSKFPIRGEAFLYKSDFEKINKDRISKNLEPYKNIRNAAAGILRRLDNNPYFEMIQYLCYDVLGYDVSEIEKLKYIKKYTNFTPVDFIEFNNTEKAMIEIPLLYEKGFSSQIPIDGIAIKSNIDKSLAKFGSTEHHPLNSFAWKSEQERISTKLKEVIWQVGRESINPVGVFEPVIIDGTTVDRASLHNWKNIVDLDLKINDDIFVEKRNQIIPHIVKVISHNKDSYPIDKPVKCPSCGELLLTRKLKKTSSKEKEITNDEIEFYCPNNKCNGKLLNKIDFVFGKKCLNAKGLSHKTIEKLINTGKVKKITDMFSLTKQDFIDLDGFKDKSAENNYNSIQNTRKEVPFSKFIPACGIISIGFNVGKILASKYTYESLLSVLKNKKINELEEIKDIGHVLALKLISNEFIMSFEELKSFVSIKYDDNHNKLKSNSNVFVITGSLSKPRDYFVKLIENNGDKVINSINKNVFALVTNDLNSNSSKSKQAHLLNIPTFNEEMIISYLKK